MKYIKMILLTGFMVLFTACTSSSNSNSVEQAALTKIMAYADDQNQPVPSVEDYEDAGVVGVTAGNLDDVNDFVAGQASSDVETTEEIQAILEANGLIPDTTKPVITLGGNTPINVTQGTAYTDAGATAQDNVDGDITGDIVTVNPVNTNTVGQYTVTYNVSDTAGNAATQVTRTVNVVAAADTTKPVITLLGNTPINVTQGTAYNDAGATAQDNVDGDITGNIVTVNPVDTNTVGQYTVTYNVSDTAGNAATQVTRTVNVVAPSGDTTKPVITLLGNTPIDVTQGTAYTDAGATALDDVDGDITGNIVTVNPVNTNTIGQYTVTYNVSDAAGNAATQVTRTVNVVAAVPVPVLNSIAAGHTHTVEIRNDGTLWSYGYNYDGQLGNPAVTDPAESNTPVQESTQATDWASVSAGGDSRQILPHLIQHGANYVNGYTVAIKTDGTLYAWGDNTYGQLGVGDNVDKDTPTQVGSDNTWTMVSAADHHVVALKNGTLWAWGRNNHGQLGNGSTTDSNTPVQIGTDTDWVSVSAGGGDYTGNEHISGHTVAIKSDGTLWTWGSNARQQLGTGDGNTTDSNVPVQVGNDMDWESVSAGDSHTVAIKTNGTLWSWGYNGPYSGYGLLGVEGYYGIEARGIPTQEGTGATNWKSVSAGSWHTVAIQDDGTLWSWGRNDYGQIGDGTLAFKRSPVQEGNSDTNWTVVSAGAHHTVAIKDGTTLFSWGDNYFGQLGNGVQTNKYVAIQEDTNATDWNSTVGGGKHTVAMKDGQTLWAWGEDLRGQLGDNGAPTNKSVPVQEDTSATDWNDMSAGFEHTVAIRDGGTLWAWGHNEFGQVANGPVGPNNHIFVPTEIVLPAVTWKSVESGGWHSAAITNDGALWTWGRNHYGQLGTGDATDSPTLVQVPAGAGFHWDSVSTSDNHTLAIKVQNGNDTNRTLWAWGWNEYGQLGTGDTTDSNNSVQVGTDTDWESISAADYHSVAIKTDGTLWTWGWNIYGQLGYGTVIGNNVTPSQALIPTQVVIDGEPARDNQWLMASTGDFHTVAIQNDGTLWVWGDNEFGQLAAGYRGGEEPLPAQVAVGSYGTHTSDWVSVSGGDLHNVAINANGELWAWGYNEYGQTYKFVTVPTQPQP